MPTGARHCAGCGRLLLWPFCEIAPAPSRLHHLDLRGCHQLPAESPGLAALPSLTHLALPPHMLGLLRQPSAQSVTRLDLGGCELGRELGRVPCAVTDLPRLRQLSLARCGPLSCCELSHGLERLSLLDMTESTGEELVKAFKERCGPRLIVRRLRTNPSLCLSVGLTLKYLSLLFRWLSRARSFHGPPRRLVQLCSPPHGRATWFLIRICSPTAVHTVLVSPITDSSSCKHILRRLQSSSSPHTPVNICSHAGSGMPREPLQVLQDEPPTPSTSADSGLDQAGASSLQALPRAARMAALQQAQRLPPDLPCTVDRLNSDFVHPESLMYGRLPALLAAPQPDRYAACRCRLTMASVFAGCRAWLVAPSYSDACRC